MGGGIIRSRSQAKWKYGGRLTAKRKNASHKIGNGKCARGDTLNLAHRPIIFSPRRPFVVICQMSNLSVEIVAPDSPPCLNSPLRESSHLESKFADLSLMFACALVHFGPRGNPLRHANPQQKGPPRALVLVLAMEADLTWLVFLLSEGDTRLVFSPDAPQLLLFLLNVFCGIPDIVVFGAPILLIRHAIRRVCDKKHRPLIPHLRNDRTCPIPAVIAHREFLLVCASRIGAYSSPIYEESGSPQVFLDISQCGNA